MLPMGSRLQEMEEGVVCASLQRADFNVSSGDSLVGMFIGPETDHCLLLSLTHSLSD